MHTSTQDPTTTLYHLGLALDCPVDQARVGGYRLVKRSERVGFDRHGQTTRAPLVGEYARLTREQVEKIREGVARAAVRQVGAGEYICVSTAKREVLISMRALDVEVTLEDGSKAYERKEIPVRGSRRIREERAGDQPLAAWVFLEPAGALPHEDAPSARPFAPAPSKPKPAAKSA